MEAHFYNNITRKIYTEIHGHTRDNKEFYQNDKQKFLQSSKQASTQSINQGQQYNHNHNNREFL